MKRRGIFSIVVAVLLVAVLIVFLIAFQVRINESAIVFTFGKVDRVITEPGLYWKLPYPIQTVTKYDTRLNVFETKYREYLTTDQVNILVAFAIGWAVENPQAFYESVGSRTVAETRLSSLAQGMAQGIINRHRLDQFITTTAQDFKFGDIQSEVLKVAAEKARAEYGIAVSYVDITKFNFPEDVTKDVLDRIKAERKSIADGLIAEGKAKATEIRADADLKASQIHSEAEGKAITTRGQGDAEASKYYEVFRAHPELAKFLRALQAVEQLKKRATYILTTANPPYDLLSPNLIIPGAQAPPKDPGKTPAPAPKTGTTAPDKQPAPGGDQEKPQP